MVLECNRCGENAPEFEELSLGSWVPVCNDVVKKWFNGGPDPTQDVFRRVVHQHKCECGKEWKE